MKKSATKFVMKLIHHKKSTTYYVTLLLMIGLSFGLGTAILTGGSFLSADPSLALALHESPLVVTHDAEGEHHQTVLGDFLFGKEARAHKFPYCGGGTIWPVVSGVQHRVKHLYWYDNGDNHIRTDHYFWGGTGYVRVDGSREDYRIDC